MRAKRPGTNGNRGETSQGANGIRGETTRCIRLDGPAARCSGRPKLPRQFVPVRNFEPIQTFEMDRQTNKNIISPTERMGVGFGLFSFLGKK